MGHSRMRTEVLLIERGVAPGQVLRARKAHARGRSIDPFGLSFELEEHTDGSLIDTDDAGFSGRRKFGAIFLISKARLVPEPVKYLRKRERIGDIELDFLADFISSAARRSFIGNHRSIASATETKQLVGAAQLAGIAVEDGIGFEGSRLDQSAAGVFDETPGGIGTVRPPDLDFDFEIGSAHTDPFQEVAEKRGQTALSTPVHSSRSLAQRPGQSGLTP